MTPRAAESVPGIPELFDPSALSIEWRRVVADAFALGAYPWHTLSDGLMAKTGRSRIPIDVADLSRWGASAAQAAEDDLGVAQVVDHDEHHHGPDHDEWHAVGAHLVAFRRRALGLAWYSGRVTLEETLLPDAAQAAEVLWFELAHMVDFFGLSPDQRRAIFAAFHGGQVTAHGHGTPEDWFGDADRTGYWFQVGEAWMLAFTRAVTPIRARIGAGLAHTLDEAALDEIRRILPTAEPEPPPGPGTTPPAPFFGGRRSSVFHDEHRGARADERWATYAEAIEAGRRPCRVCRPRP
jgi:hypothetical protein